MLDWIGRAWRVVATGVSFATFGIGGLVLGFIVAPLLNLLVRDRARRASIGRYLIHLGFRGFIEWMRLLGLLRYTIIDRHKLDRSGLLVLANHPTLLDVVFLISLIPNADCVVRSGLFKNPFTRGPLRAANYLCNDSGAGLIDDCIASLRAGNNLVMFPEGTRTPVAGPMSLQRGAANIAVRGQRDITPVRIRCVPLSLTKGLPWWRVPARRMHFTIRVDDDIAVAAFCNGDDDALAARRLTQHLHQHFAGELND